MNTLKFFYILSGFLLLSIMLACNPEDIISELGDSNITAKSKVSEVLNTAKATLQKTLSFLLFMV
jgi:hypothetical protein